MADEVEKWGQVAGQLVANIPSTGGSRGQLRVNNGYGGRSTGQMWANFRRRRAEEPPHAATLAKSDSRPMQRRRRIAIPYDIGAVVSMKRSKHGGSKKKPGD